MANQQTRQYRKHNLSVHNDALTWHEGKGGKEPSVTSFESTKGRCVNSSAERAASGRKKYVGNPDARRK